LRVAVYVEQIFRVVDIVHRLAVAGLLLLPKGDVLC
jgi:hypothetical protein